MSNLDKLLADLKKKQDEISFVNQTISDKPKKGDFEVEGTLPHVVDPEKTAEEKLSTQPSTGDTLTKEPITNLDDEIKIMKNPDDVEPRKTELEKESKEVTEVGPLPTPMVPVRDAKRARVIARMTTILNQHGGIVSNIPINSEYYTLKSQLKG